MLKYIKKFLHYMLMPLRLVVFLILVFIGVRIGANCNDKYFLRSMLMVYNELFLYLLSARVEIDDEDVRKYTKYLYSDKKFLAVFNHTSTVDGFAIMKTFPAFSFIMSKLQLTQNINVYNLIGYTDKYHEKVGSIFVESGTTTDRIIQYVGNRKEGDNVLFIAPSAGITPVHPGSISEFKGSGAFAGKFPILPIIIKNEDDTLDCYEGESIIHQLFKMFLLYDYRIKIKVLDMIEPDETESIMEYKNRVFNIMNEEYKKIKIDK